MVNELNEQNKIICSFCSFEGGVRLFCSLVRLPDSLRLIANQEANDIGNIFRPSIALQRRCHLLSFFGRILLAVRDIELRDSVEHVRHSAAGSYSVDGDLLLTAVFGEDCGRTNRQRL